MILAEDPWIPFVFGRHVYTFRQIYLYQKMFTDVRARVIFAAWTWVWQTRFEFWFSRLTFISYKWPWKRHFCLHVYVLSGMPRWVSKKRIDECLHRKSHPHIYWYKTLIAREIAIQYELIMKSLCLNSNLMRWISFPNRYVTQLLFFITYRIMTLLHLKALTSWSYEKLQLSTPPNTDAQSSSPSPQAA